MSFPPLQVRADSGTLAACGSGSRVGKQTFVLGQAKCTNISSRPQTGCHALTTLLSLCSKTFVWRENTKHSKIHTMCDIFNPLSWHGGEEHTACSISDNSLILRQWRDGASCPVAVSWPSSPAIGCYLWYKLQWQVVGCHIFFGSVSFRNPHKPSGSLRLLRLQLLVLESEEFDATAVKQCISHNQPGRDGRVSTPSRTERTVWDASLPHWAAAA